MKKLNGPKVILPLLAALLSVHGTLAQSPAQETNSAKSLQKSDTGVSSPHVSKGPTLDQIINSCAAAVDDLKTTRDLVNALEVENAALKTRLETEKQTTALLTELNTTRKSETDALRETVTAKNEAIAAKDAVIASQDKLIETLKKKKTSPWKRFGDVLIGAALFAILK
jgi:hypothetical protein